MQPGGNPITQAIGARLAQIAMGILGRGRGLPEVRELTTKLASLLDDESARAMGPAQTKLACEAGCDHCCHRVVPSSVGEVATVAHWIEARFTESQRADLLIRLEAYERVVAPSFGLELETLRPVCPLLTDGKCSIYPVRPFDCRTRHAFDRKACASVQAGDSIAVPSLPLRNQIGELISQGNAQALRHLGVVAVPHDFARALLLALRDPATLPRWLEGQVDFLPAVIRQTPDVSMPSPAQPVHRQYRASEEPTGHFDLSGLMVADTMAMSLGDVDGAIRAARGNHPGDALFRARVPVTYTSEDEVLQWREYFQNAIEELRNAQFDPKQAFDGLVAFRSHEIIYQQFNNRDILAAVGDLLCNRIAARALPDLTKPIEKVRKPGPIRVGFISQGLRSSSCAPWALGWLRHLAPEFETHAIHLGDFEDQVSMEFKRLAKHYRHLPRRNPVPSDARTIKALDLDVLIYLDIGTNMRNGQLATLRLARVQCAAWGGPETSGYPTIDYYLSGELMETEDADAHYTEKLVRLPRTGVCFERAEFPVSNLRKEDFGVGDGPLIVCLQHAPKLAPRWDPLYRAICEATGRPIVFVDKPRVASQVAWERLTKAGVRLHTLPYLGMSDYLGLIRCADVILDPPGWNGGITTIHALQHGAPVVTLPTELRRGRQSYAFLHAGSGPGLIAKDQADYVDLVANGDRRRAAHAPFVPDAMFDDLASVRGLEQFIRSVASD